MNNVQNKTIKIVSSVLQVYSLPGVTLGPDKSYLKWVPDSGARDLRDISLCMRWGCPSVLDLSTQTMFFFGK